MRKYIEFGKHALLVLILLVGMVYVVSASIEQEMPDETDLESMYSDANLPEDLQIRVIDAIKASDLPEKEKKELIKGLKDIWSKKSKLPEQEQQELFAAAASIVRDYLNIDGGEVSVLWNSLQHSDLARTAGIKVGVPSQYWDILYYQTNTPDSWPRYWGDHFWFVNSRPQYGFGPYNTGLFATGAKNIIDFYPESGYTSLAYSIHYMSDLANPFHTTSSLIALFYHGSYEKYVSDNWNLGYNFNQTIQIVNSADLISTNNPEQNAKNLATKSYPYVNYILFKMRTDPRWKEDRTVIAYTNNSLTNATLYNMGLINYTIN